MNSENQRDIILRSSTNNEEDKNFESYINTNIEEKIIIYEKTCEDLKNKLFNKKVNKNVFSSDGSFVPGQFDYVKYKNVREMFVTAWQAINMTESWHFIAQNIESFMWTDYHHPQMTIINNKLNELYDNHSGFTYGYTMRTMQFIAKN